MTSLKPLIAICGTTGVGKSKLGIELALKLADQQVVQDHSEEHRWRGARIINSDSMQVYTGMDIITNKVTQAERMGVEHLLMDMKQPGEQYIVGQWVHDAIQVIEETHQMNQIPIVVGGTSYWMQHLLFPNRLANQDVDPTTAGSTASDSPLSASLQTSVSQLTPNLFNLWMALPESPPNAATHPKDALSLHELLQALDPPVASRWHWRDTRKVLRSLRIMQETRRTPSEIISQQSESPLIPRYRTLCFWLCAQPSALNPRLDERVDDMIKHGLLDEIKSLQKIISSSQAAVDSSSVNMGDEASTVDQDYTLGIYQCIGFKEFREFLSLSNDSPGSQKAFNKAVENMKQSTRKYAKRQVTWLRNKLLPAIHSANINFGNEIPVASMYILDATVLGDQWASNVLSPAESIMQSFLREKELPPPASLSSMANAVFANQSKSVDPSDVLRARRKIVCQVCTTDPRRPVMIEEQLWDAHRGNRLHRRLVARSKKRSDGSPLRLRDRVGPGKSSADESLDPEKSLPGPS